MKIAFIGLGNMGRPIAANLLKAGHELTVYNRTRSRAELLRKAGAKVADTPAEAAANAEVVISMLADDQALEQVVLGDHGILSAMPSGAIHVSMSTISVELARRLTELHRQRGHLFVSAPVFGRPEAAETRKLFVVAAGPQAALSRCQPLFDAVGQRTFVIGQEPSAANVVKLSGNFLIASVIECLGEAIALARKHGLDPRAYLEIFTESLFNAPVYKTYGSRIADDEYEPVGFRLVLGLKDIRLALAAADSAAVPMPVASLIHDRAVSAVARGLGDADWASVARIIAEDAGLQPLHPAK